MASRTASRQAASASSSPAPPRRSFPLAQPASTTSPQLRELRCQWKWAAVSQFLHTFAQLVALEDVSLVDIEEDLVNSTMVVIPRLMQRLLLTLSHDRKITVDNWQTALRRQYLRRDPGANPIGFEPAPSRVSRAPTVETDIKSEERNSVLVDDTAHTETDRHSPLPDGCDGQSVPADSVKHPSYVGTPDGEATAPLHSHINGLVKEEEAEVSRDAQDSTKNWSNLTTLEKLESIHTVVEWHFQSPLRLRSIMHSDDENASWRIEPIGYDAKRNAYWLIGSDRLWIQRVPPKPPKRAAKRKAASNADNRKAKVARVAKAASSKKRGKDSSETTERPKANPSRTPATPQRTRRGSRHPHPSNDDETQLLSPGVSGRVRAAKTQANVKLDLQAKQLAATKAELESLNRKSGRSSPTKPSSRRTLGIRASRRLRGTGDDDDDEWQQIPEEWLHENENDRNKPRSSTTNTPTTRSSTRRTGTSSRTARVVPLAKTKVSGLGSDDESDLTELSDSEGSSYRVESAHEEPPLESSDVVPPEPEVTIADEPEPVAMQLPPDFVEWETLCISLQEWEEMSHRFEKATHYLEKALHKVLTQEVIPFVTEALREAEKLRMKEDALLNRKRSSRIAIKDMEKETARMEAMRRAEEEEKMARLRRVEARARREEEERLKREQAREQRRREREEREAARNRRLERVSDEEDEGVGQRAREARLNGSTNSKQNLPVSEVHKPSRHRTKKKANKKSSESENWELDCEICGSRGINRDDGVPLMSCGRCNKWQHINCHDAVDRKAGRALRDWDSVDFFCKRCRMSGRASSAHEPAHLLDARQSSTRESPDGWHRRGYGSLGLTNGITETPTLNSVPALNHNLPGPASFTGFSHYHPHQHGFSPNPSGLQHQFYPQSRTSADSTTNSQSPHPHGSPLTWNSTLQGSSSDPRGFNQTCLPRQPQTGVVNAPPAYHQHPSAGLAPTQDLQYTPTYFSNSP